MSKNQQQSSDIVMGLFGFIVSIVAASVVKQSLTGSEDSAAWVLWMGVAICGGMVLGVAISNIMQDKKKSVTAKADGAKKSAKKKANG